MPAYLGVKPTASALLLPSVFCLATAGVAESFVLRRFSAPGVWTVQGKRLAAVFATGDVAAGSHEPPQLQVHRPQKVVELPFYEDVRGVYLRVGMQVWPQALSTVEAYYFLRGFNSCPHSNSQREVVVRDHVERPTR